MIERTKLRITTITPVTIGSGVELSPYADYFIDGNMICFLDKKKVHDKIIQKGNQYLDLYVQGVATGMEMNGNNRSEFDLRSFLLNNKIVQSMDEVVSSKCNATIFSNQKLPIKGIIKSPLAEPYFPGSSVKGALKTILMYNWLKTNKDADRMIEEVVKGKEIEKNREKKWIAGNFDSLEKKFECFVNDKNELVRSNTIQQVTDSKMMPKDSNFVVDCYRAGIPLRFECIAKEQTSEFELTLDNYKWEDLAEQANKYAEDVLEREFALIESDKKMTLYYNFLADIEEKILETGDGIAYIRIGFGKGYYLNSLGIAIYDYVTQKGNENLYDKFEKFINNQFAKTNKYGSKQEIDLDDFPKTRLFVTTTKEPLGWIKVEKM